MKSVKEAILGRQLGVAAGIACANRVPFFGAIIDTHDPVISNEVKIALLLRRYERAEMTQTLAMLDPDRDFVEIGSGIGATAAAITRRLRGGRFVTFEFRPELLSIARANLNHNARCAWELIESAVDSSADRFEATLPVGAFGSKESVACAHGTRTVTADAVRLSGALAERGFGPYQLLCDIEGAEYDLLANDSAALDRCEAAVVELHPDHCPASIAELCAMFIDRGLRVVSNFGPVYTFRR